MHIDVPNLERLDLCGIERDDWSEFTVPQSVTHLYLGRSNFDAPLRYLIPYKPSAYRFQNMSELK